MKKERFPRFFLVFHTAVARSRGSVQKYVVSGGVGKICEPEYKKGSDVFCIPARVFTYVFSLFVSCIFLLCVSFVPPELFFLRAFNLLFRLDFLICGMSRNRQMPTTHKLRADQNSSGNPEYILRDRNFVSNFCHTKNRATKSRQLTRKKKDKKTKHTHKLTTKNQYWC